ARMSWPGYCSSLPSSRSKSVKASAVAPAKPPITSPLASRRTFLAFALTMVWPIDTWPSPPTATMPPLRTVRMVVPCQESGGEGCMESVLIPTPDLGTRPAQRKPSPTPPFGEGGVGFFLPLLAALADPTLPSPKTGRDDPRHDDPRHD